MTTSPRWSVVSFVDEPPQLILAFVAHYLDLGASEVHLCLDRRQDRLAGILRLVPGVRVTVLDADYWAALGLSRPKHFNRRQRLVTDHAAKSMDCDFLLHVDSDEFVVPDRPVAEQLAQAPDGIANLYFAPVERVVPWDHTPETSIFAGRCKQRLPLGPQEREEIWSSDADQFCGQGFHGHSLGKSLVRLGQMEMRIEPHFGVPADRDLDLRESVDWFNRNSMRLSGHLLHFDGLTPLHWALKLMRRNLPETDGNALSAAHVAMLPRYTQQRHLRDGAETPGAIAALARRVQSLTPEQEAMLEARGGILDVPHRIEATAKRLFPDRRLDFSIRAFDNSLRRRLANSPHAGWMAGF
jgi:hypothetical protein